MSQHLKKKNILGDTLISKYGLPIFFMCNQPANSQKSDVLQHDGATAAASRERQSASTLCTMEISFV